MALGAGLGFGVGCAVAVGVGVGAGLGEGDGVGEGDGAGSGVGVGVGAGVGRGVGPGVGGAVGTGVGTGVGVGPGPTVGAGFPGVGWGAAGSRPAGPTTGINDDGPTGMRSPGEPSAIGDAPADEPGDQAATAGGAPVAASTLPEPPHGGGPTIEGPTRRMPATASNATIPPPRTDDGRRIRAAFLSALARTSGSGPMGPGWVSPV